jgi:hypothetical protein
MDSFLRAKRNYAQYETWSVALNNIDLAYEPLDSVPNRCCRFQSGVMYDQHNMPRRVAGYSISRHFL